MVYKATLGCFQMLLDRNSNHVQFLKKTGSLNMLMIVEPEKRETATSYKSSTGFLLSKK